MTVDLAQIQALLAEDIGTGDITAAIIPPNIKAEADTISREAMVVCGQAWFEAVFKTLDSAIKIEWLVAEGKTVVADSTLCRIKGPARGLLTGERTALNLLQTLSATATLARQYSDAVAGTGCKVLDTRKTIPGLRLAQKYAVACGGCYNHRIGLYDGVLIKENHIIAAGSIAKAIQTARTLSNVPVEIEVESLSELAEAVAAKPDRIMLDNFNLQDLCAAVAFEHGKIELEASGNIDLSNIRQVAETGVDFISIGALTKNVDAVDLSMRIKLIQA
ncbi:MAG: carboxylating nicotinate-nucleotide diphosphorylase [Methylococcaceae bacterium]|nr:carboxylating nicotinate-nucleotide diphosphorylase [Methylococcaceae bacterium]